MTRSNMNDPENDFDSVHWRRGDEHEDQDGADNQESSRNTTSSMPPPSRPQNKSYDSSSKRSRNNDNDDDDIRGGNAPPNARETSLNATAAGGEDRAADATDLAGIGSEGYLLCTVDRPQKENDGTKDAFVSYLISVRVRRASTLSVVGGVPLEFDTGKATTE